MTGQLATKFKFLKPDARGGRGGYAKYIATREGVEKIQGASLHAYADYIALRPGAERTGRHGLFTEAGVDKVPVRAACGAVWAPWGPTSGTGGAVRFLSRGRSYPGKSFQGTQ